ncbi:MAG: fumarate reductase subunit FrdD [Candidatus Methylomirabilales bacterium]
MYEIDKTEPFLWGLFSAGGVVAALFVPIHIIIAGLAVPLGLLGPDVVGYTHMRALLGNPLVKLYLFVLVALPLFHAAHRLRFALKDMGLKAPGQVLGMVLYSGAILGTVVAAIILAGLP